jgi:hypothetical protein
MDLAIIPHPKNLGLTVNQIQKNRGLVNMPDLKNLDLAVN